MLLAGRGDVSMAGFELDAVGDDVPITGGADGGLPASPQNLDFSEAAPRS